MANEQLELFPTEVGYELYPPEENKSEMEQLPTIQDAEWCFQFFNNEPVVFAWQQEGVEPNPLVLQIEPKDGDGLNFQQNGMSFRIFPRPISEKTKQQRQDESKDKEA
jgi:hypothetical protein